MKPSFISHETYQNHVMELLRTHYSHGVLHLTKNDWPVLAKLWITDLSYITEWLYDSYSSRGPEPRDPVAMWRSYLLFLFVNPSIGITRWIDQLHRVPLYAIISGFEPGDVPGVGTFYDFFQRIWKSDAANSKPSVKPKYKKKNKTTTPKEGEKAPPKKSNIVRKHVDRFLKNRPKRKHLSADHLFEFFQSQFLKISGDLGLLGNLSSLSVAGDGTPIVTARYIRTKPTCDCRSIGINNCIHPRHYSQPDIDRGWDSSRAKYYNGYHLYMLSASDSPNDLPLYPRLQPASRHDSVSYVVSSIEFMQRFTIGVPKRMLLDSAHDADAIYELLSDQEIDSFIDLNTRKKKTIELKGDILISEVGIPICPINLPMKQNGFDKSQNRRKWICPLAIGKKISCTMPCSEAKYGRTFHTFEKDNLRMFPKTPRSSKEWKKVYDRRTSIERSNKRQKIDYQYEAGRHRSTKMWYIRLYSIMMCQHIDAWYNLEEDNLQLNENIFGEDKVS